MGANDVATQRSKTAIVLAGGGVTGAVYEIGALRALDDLLIGARVNDADIFVGTSAGSLVAACLANGLTPREMMRHLESSVDGVSPLSFRDVFSLDGRGLLSRGFRLPQALAATIGSIFASGGHLSLLDAIESFARALPGGLYDSSALDRYLENVFARPGLVNDFRLLRRELAIIATDLDSGARMVFGRPPHDQVTISKAVAASSAMPLVYRPVRIDGRDYIDGGVRGNASVDLAIERGAKLIICVNPLVPFDQMNADTRRHIRDLGAPAVALQTFRTFAHAGLHYHLKQIKRTHPDVDVVLIEPARDDVLMFNEMPMRYGTRMAIARHAFESVTARLCERYDEYQALLARHGIHLERRHAVERLVAVSHQMNAPKRGTRDLRATLSALEHTLEQLNGAA